MPKRSVRARIPLRARKSILVALAGPLLGLIGVLAVTFSGPATATAATSSYLNFQARLLTAAGSVVPDGNYNVEFKIYNASSSTGSSQGSCTGDAACQWVETRTGANQVRVVNGYLTVNLGSVNAFSSTMPWDQQLWLTMNIGGTGGTPSWDGEMSPRIQLTAVPYAFKAGAALQLQNASYTTLLTGGSGSSVSMPQASSSANALYFGGDTTADFYRSAAGTIKTDGGFVAGGNITLAGSSPVISASTSNTSLTIQANGTGALNINTSTTGNVNIGNSTGSISLNGNTSLASGKSLTVSGYSNLAVSSLSNSPQNLPQGVQTGVAFAPFGGSWHDLLAFNKWLGTPTFETYNGTSWSSATLDSNVFAEQDRNRSTIIDGVSNTAARWTWNNGNANCSDLSWFILGFPYNATASNKNFLIETSTDGTTWTTQHTSSGNTANATSVYLPLSSSTGCNGSYVRLTVTITNSVPLYISTIKGLSNRPGDQGGGSEYQYPYVWNSSQQIGFGSGAAAANGVVTIGTNTTAASGGLYFGTDTDLYRSGSGNLQTDGNFNVTGNIYLQGTSSYIGLLSQASGNTVLATRVSGDAANRFSIQNNGTLNWGDGTNPMDTNLYRSAANTLQTDDSLNVNGGKIQITNSSTQLSQYSANGSLKVTTPTGYVSIGSENSSWAHFYTDRANYYFNQAVYTANGKFSSYGTTDLQLQSGGTTGITLQNSTGDVGIGMSPVTTGAKLQVSGSITATSSIGFTNTGNANQGINLNMVVTSAVTAGDVVVIDTSNAGQVTDSTTANSTQVVGIATTTNSAGVAQPIVMSGVYQVNVTGTVNVGDYLVTSTTTGTAQATSTPTGGVIGQALSTASGGKVWAIIRPSAGGGGTTNTTINYNSYGLMESDFTDTGSSVSYISHGQVATIGNTIYFFGGMDTSNIATNKIYSAPVSNPTNVTYTGFNLPNYVRMGSLAIVGSNIYLYGGIDNSGNGINAIYSAPTSSPTSWSIAGALPAGVSLNQSSLAIIGNYIYLFGGINGGSTFTNEIYRAPISSPTNMVDASATIPIPLRQSTVAVIGNYVYLFGGINSSNVPVNAIYRAPISNPLSWTTTSGSFPASTADGSSNLAIVGSYVYLISGYETGGYTNLLWKAPISNPVNGWVSTGSTLPNTMAIGAVQIVGNALYVYGGNSTGGSLLNIYSAPIFNGSPDVSSNPSWITDSNYSSGGGSGTSSQTANSNYELAYAQIPASVNITTTTATNVVSAPSITTDGHTSIRLEFDSPYVQVPGGNNLNVALYDNGTFMYIFNVYNYTSGFNVPGYGSYEYTPSAGSHTYSVQAYLQAASGTATIGSGPGAYSPGYLRITLANPSLQGGSGIANGTTTQTANFNVQSSSASSVTAVIQGATSQSADILDVRNSSNSNLLSVDASGNLTVAGNIQFANTGNANQALTVNEVVTSAVTAGDVVVIDTANAGQVTDSTSANSTKVFGIATQTKTAGQAQPIVISGIYQVNVTGSVNVGDYLVTSSTTGQAQDTTSPSGGIVGQAMSTASAGQAWVLVKPASGAGGSSGSSNNYGLMESDFTDTGAALPAALYGSQTVTIGNYVYMLGGLNSSNVAVNVIYRAPVSNPTAWVNTGGTLPGALAYSSAAVIGSYVYLFGGMTSPTTSTNVIYRAPVSDPVSSWTNTGKTIPGNDGSSSLAVIGSNVYLFGGYNGSRMTAIYSASISDPTTWTTAAGSLPVGISNTTVAVVGNYVYLFDGYESGGLTNVILRAPISSPASSGSWVATTGTLPAISALSAIVVVGNYIYALGGTNSSNVAQQTIYKAPVNNPVNGWVNTGSVIPSTLTQSQAAIVGNAVYLFGGLTSSNATGEIYSAPIYNGSPDVSSNPSWKVDSNYSSGGGSGTSSQTTSTSTELAYAQFTSNVGISATTESTASTIVTAPSITADGNTPILINFFAPEAQSDNNVATYAYFYVYQDGSSIGEIVQKRVTASSGSPQVNNEVNGQLRITPTAGSHTYSIRAAESGVTWTILAGPGGSGQLQPGFIRITLANPQIQGGSGIANGTTTQTANFNVQSSSASSVTAVIQGATSQSADILDVRNSSNSNLLSVDASGNLTVAGNIGFANTGNANQALTVNENVTGSVTAGDVVVIDTSNAGYVTDSTTANSTKVFGIATKTQTGGSEPIVISGIYQVNVGATTVNLGDYLVTSSTAGQATTSSSPSGGIVGQAMSTASGNKAWVLVKPASGAGGGSGSSNNYGLMESDFTNVGTIPAAIQTASVITVGNNLYMYGGFNGTSATNAIYTATTSNPTNWTLVAGKTLPNTNYDAQVAIIGSTIYMFGGWAGGSSSNVIWSAPVSDPTTWTNTGATLPGRLSNSQIAIIGNNIYLYGGYDSLGSGAVNVIYSASLSAPTVWSNTGASIPGTSNNNLSLAVVGTYVYLFAGGASQNAIYRASISSPTSWSTMTQTLPGALGASQLTIIGNYMYMIGGYTTSGSAPTNVIYKAPINNPLAWVNSGVTLPASIEYSQSMIVGNAFYIFGGQTGASTYTNVIYSTPIYNGSPDLSSNPSWKVDANYASGGGSGTSSQTSTSTFELAYGEFTGAFSTTANSEATSTAIVSSPSYTYDGSTPVIVDFFASGSYNTSTSNNVFELFEDSTDLGRFGTTANAAANDYKPLYFSKRIMPSAGSHTFTVKMWVGGGTGYVLAGASQGPGYYQPAYIRVTRANPSLQGGTGSGIQNGTTTQVANFNVQSASANNPTAVIKGATSQSSDILDVQNSSNINLLSVDPNGNTFVAGNLNVGGNIGFSNIGNANQAMTVNEVVTSAVTAGDVVVIDVTNAGQVTDSTTANSTKVFGIATQTQGAGVSQPIVISGIYQVNVAGSVNVGDYLVTSTTIGAAQDTTSPSGGVIGQAMSTASGGKAWVRVNPGNGAGVNGTGGAGYGLMESDFTSAGSLGVNVSGTSTVTIGNYIYMFGGFNGGLGTGTSTSQAILRAPVNNPTSWTNMGNLLPSPLSFSSVAIVGNYVYLFGGFNGTSTISTIYRAQVSDPVNTWTSVGNIYEPIIGSQLAIIGNTIYMFGGNNSAITNRIYTAPVSNPTSWSLASGTLATGVDVSEVAVIGNYVYIFGGYIAGGNFTQVVQRAPVSNPAGTGAWTNLGNLMPSTTAYGNLAIIGNYVYILGEGITTSTNGGQANIYRAPLTNPTSWTNLNVTMPGGVAESAVYIAGNAVYVAGGDNSSNTAISTIYSAPIINGSPDVSSNPSWITDSNASSGGSGTSSQTANTNTELAYSTMTSVYNVSSTNSSSPNIVLSSSSITTDGNTPVLVNFYSPEAAVQSSTTVYMIMYRDSTQIGNQVINNNTTGDEDYPINIMVRDTPSAGSHTYSFEVYKSNTNSVTFYGGTGATSAYAPAYIRITLANPSLQGGSGISNATTTQTANFNIQSSNASNVTAVIQGATSQSADILDVRNSSNSNLLSVDASGNLTVAGSIGFSNSGNASQVMTVNEVVTTAVNAGDVVVIDTNNAGQVTTTTLANSTKVFGVATKTMVAGQSQPIAISGIYQVNVDTGAVNVGDYLVTSGTSGKATDSSSPSGGVIGQAMSAKTAGSNGTVWVRLNPGNGAGGGGGSNSYGLMESEWANTGATIGGTYPSDMYATYTVGNNMYLLSGNQKIYTASTSNPTSWTDSGATFPVALIRTQVVIVGSYIYTLGGYSGGDISTIYRASVSSPTSFSSYANLPGASAAAQAAIIGNYVYLFGGEAGGYSSTIYKASIADLSTAGWATYGAAGNIATAVKFSQLDVIGNYVYLFGGENSGATNLRTVQRAPISNPLSWTSYSNIMPGNGVGYGQTAIIGNYVYIFGGWNPTNGYLSTMYRAPISDPLNGWGSAPLASTLPAGRGYSALAIAGNAVYLLGGSDSNQIWSAPIYSNGGPDTSSNPSWKVDSNYSLGGGGSGTSSQTSNGSYELAYGTISGQITTTNTSASSPDILITAPSFTADGSTSYTVQVYSPIIEAPSNNYVNFQLFDNGTNVFGAGYRIAQIGSSTSLTESPLNATVKLTPSAGSHQYSLRWNLNVAGTGKSYNEAPGFIRVTLANPSLQGGSGIANGTIVQTGNFNIQSANGNNPTAVIQGAASQSADILDVKSGSGSILFNVTPTGNVGIGIASPGAKLDVLGSNGGIRISDGGLGGEQILTFNAASGSVPYTWNIWGDPSGSNGGLYFGQTVSNPTTAATLTLKNNRVGVNDTNPSTTLSVGGNATIEGNSLYNYNYPCTSWPSDLNSATASGYLYGCGNGSPANAPGGGALNGFVYFVGSSGAAGVQYYLSYSGTQYHRTLWYGTWYGWTSP